MTKIVYQKKGVHKNLMDRQRICFETENETINLL